MYKRIVHNIIEEHYDDSIGTAKVSVGTRVGVASELQMSIKGLLRNIVLNLRGYVVSVLVSADNSDSLLSKIMIDLDKFGEFLGGYYGNDRVFEITQHLKKFVNSISRIMVLAKSGSDYSMTFDEALLHIDSVAVGMSKLNPEHWPESVVGRYLRLYAGIVMNQIVARLAEDWNSELNAINYANRVMFNGPVDIAYNLGSPDFAELIAAGIFKQFPRKF